MCTELHFKWSVLSAVPGHSITAADCERGHCNILITHTHTLKRPKTMMKREKAARIFI